MTSSFLKEYWQYKRDGGGFTMKQYASAVKENCSHIVEGPPIKKPFRGDKI